jgi:hypothetical protein
MLPQPRVFISYARADGEDFAEDLSSRITSAGIPVWRDREGMRGGQDWWEQIDTVLSQVEFVAVVMTPGAVESEIVRKEWHLARERGVCVFPVIASDKLLWSEMPVWMRRGHCYDLTHQAQKFLNDLNTRCEKIRIPFNVPDTGASHVARPALFGELIERLVNRAAETTGPVTVALRGGGGFGKSTLARSLCHDVRTRYAFHQGVLWVELGEDKIRNLAARVEDMVFWLSRERPGFVDPMDASHRLRELLRDRNVLIVIDDVWRQSDAAPFLVGGPGCAHLITTRNRDVLPEGCIEVPVNEMEFDEALQLLGARIPYHDVRADLERLAERLGRWPILMNLVNRVMRDRVGRGQPADAAISDANSRLDRQGLMAFDRRDSDARSDAVAKTVAISIDLLRDAHASADGDAVARFEELAVFPRTTDIPISAVCRLWGYDESLTIELCDQLYNYSLLQSHDLRRKTIRIHDVVLSYLRSRAGDRTKEWHTRFVESYEKASGGRWDRLADDGYYFEHLAYHLLLGGLAGKLYALIDAPWWNAQEKRTGSARAFVADIDYALDAAMDEGNIPQLVRCCYIQSAMYSRAAPVPPSTLGGLARLGLVDIARDKADLISDAKARAESFMAIAEALAATKHERAGSIYSLAFRSVQAIGPAREQCLLLTAFIRSLLASGRSSEAVEAGRACAAAAEHSNSTDPWDRIRAADMKLLLNKPEEAATLVKSTAHDLQERVPAVMDETTAWLALVDVLRRCGEMELADKIGVAAWDSFRIGPSVKRPDGVIENRFNIDLDLIEALARLDEVDLALNPEWRKYVGESVILCTIARVFRERGQPERADEFDERALESWRVSPDFGWYGVNEGSKYARPGGAATIARLLLDRGEVEAAAELAEGLDDMPLQAEILGIVGHAAAAAGRKADARRLLQRSLESSSRTFELPVPTLLKWWAALLRHSSAPTLSGRIEKWTASCDAWIQGESTRANTQAMLEFLKALIPINADAATRRCDNVLRLERGEAATVGRAEFASALAAAGSPAATAWAGTALSEVPPIIAEEQSMFALLKSLAAVASALSTMGENVQAGAVVDRLLRFFETRTGKRRGLEEIDVWDAVFRTLVPIGRAAEVVPASDRIELWSSDCFSRKVAILLDLSRDVADTHPELARDTKLAAARTALLFGLLVPADERLANPPEDVPLLAALLQEAQARLPAVRRAFLPAGTLTPEVEAVLFLSLAADALTAIDSEAATALAEEALKVIKPMVLSRYVFPRHELGLAKWTMSLVLRRALKATRVSGGNDQELIDGGYWWVVANARNSKLSSTSSAWFYLAGAREFWDEGFTELGLNLMVTALLAARVSSPELVVEIATAAIDMLAAVDEGAVLAEIVDLLDKSDVWLARRQRIQLMES